MDSMELILQELQKINGRLDSLETKVDKIQGDLTELKEDHSITREGVNTLFDWADNVAIEVKIPLKSAQ